MASKDAAKPRKLHPLLRTMPKNKDQDLVPIESIEPVSMPSTKAVGLFTDHPMPLYVLRKQISLIVEFSSCNKSFPTYHIDPSECFILNNALVCVCCL